MAQEWSGPLYSLQNDQLAVSYRRGPLVLFAPLSGQRLTTHFELLQEREKREKLSTFACRASRRLKKCGTLDHVHNVRNGKFPQRLE